MSHPFAQLLQLCWSHARALRVVSMEMHNCALTNTRRTRVEFLFELRLIENYQSKIIIIMEEKEVLLDIKQAIITLFVTKTIGIRKRRFNRSTVIIKQSEDKNYISTNYIVEQRSEPPLVNQQSLVYQFKCDLCDAGYADFTRRHVHQRVDEHSHTSCSIGKHFRDKHSSTPEDLTTNFSILKKCNSKFDCLIYEMFFIIELRPSLNVQCDSICGKVF